MSEAITVTIPGLLTRFTDGRRVLEIDGDTLTEVVERMVAKYPALEPHLFAGAGQLRAHLVICHNGRPVEWSADSPVELQSDDEIVILQAVSGG